MTRREQKHLKVTIKEILRDNQEEWWMLKREIWEIGCQPFYTAQGDFIPIIERAVFNLKPDVKRQLMDECKNASWKRRKITYSNFDSCYTSLILEEITFRASVASMRTVNW